MALHDLNRSNDTPVATLLLAEVPVKNWHKFPVKSEPTARQNVPVNSWSGGVYGDDVALATASHAYDAALGQASSYSPKTQTEKAAMMVPPGSLAVDITAPRGYIAPRDPYSKPMPAAPTIASLAPATAVAGGPDTTVVITGTNFTPWTQILNGGVQNMTAQYVSPTKMVMMFEVSASVPGTVSVVAVDHSVASAASNFTFT